MHKKVIQLTFFVFCSFFAAAQSYTEVNSYLKEKISLFYIGQPNSSNLAIHTLPVDSVIRDRDGVLFGRGGNNRMSINARFLIRLFKPWNNGGDSSLQKKVFELVRITQNPISIYFFNDALHELSPNPAVQFLLYDTVRINRRLTVYPTVIVNSRMPASRGIISLGEQYFREHGNMKPDYYFKSMLVKVQINSATIFDPWAIGRVTSGLEPGVDYYGLSNNINTNFTDHAVTFCFGYMGDTAVQNNYYNWIKTPCVILYDYDSERRGLFSSETFSELINYGFRFNSGEGTRNPNGKRFMINLTNVSELSPVVLRRYKIRNEYSQILFFEFCTRFCNGSFRKATQFISYGANRYGTTAADNKMAVLADNISKVLLGDNTPEQMISTYNDRGFLAPVLYVHFLAGAPENFTYNDFSTLAGQGYTEQLFNQYTPELRQRVIQLRRGITGQVNWVEVITSLYRTLRPQP